MTHQETGLITTLAERLKTIDEQDRGAAAAIPCDWDMRFDKDWMDKREERPVLPVQDRPEPERKGAVVGRRRTARCAAAAHMTIAARLTIS
jgi:hypothetical protein